MSKRFSNPCSRCGTERIVVRVWKEIIGGSIIENTETACPDTECQKLVVKENKKQADRNAAMKLRSEQRAINRRATRATKKSRRK